MNTKYKTMDDLINKLQSLKRFMKLKFYENLSDYCDQMNYVRQSNSFQFDEVSLLLKALKV